MRIGSTILVLLAVLLGTGDRQAMATALTSANVPASTSSRISVAAVSPQQAPAISPALQTAPSAGSQLATGLTQPECSSVCGEIKKQLKLRSREVEADLGRWQQRLGVKKDVVRYDEGLSAAEELLRFMVTHFRVQGPGGQMEPSFLTYTMFKCFPEAHVDQVHARMSKLVDTIWAAKHLPIEKGISTCK